MDQARGIYARRRRLPRRLQPRWPQHRSSLVGQLVSQQPAPFVTCRLVLADSQLRLNSKRPQRQRLPNGIDPRRLLARRRRSAMLLPFGNTL